MADSISLGIKITADGKGAESTISSLNKTIEKVGDSSKKASQSLGGIEKAAQGLGSAATTAGRALATLGVAFSARSLIQTADAYSGIVAKLKLVSGSTAEFAAAQSRLFEISQRNMTPLAETVQLYSRLATSMRDLGRSQADTLAITDLVGKTIRISGADASSAAAGILQFSQAIGSGVLRGEEFNSMMENSPRLAKALADGLNVPIGALREMAAQGELTADKVINAILSQSDAIKREYTTMPLTVSGAFQQIENALTQYVGQTDQASGASRELADALSMIAVNLNTILDPLAKVIAWITKIEIGGWLTFRDILKDITSTTGGFDPDPELQKLLQYGRGQVPIPEIAGPPPSAGGGFGGDASFFNGVAGGLSKTAQQYINAANAAWKLTAAQKQVVETIVRIGDAKGFDPAFLLSIARAETRLGELNRVSSAGAKGVFQFMDGTAKRFGVRDPWNLEQATNGAIQYLGKLKNQFKSVGLAAAGYNAGEGNVQKYGGVPPFKETQTYVRRVLQNMRDLQQAMGTSTEGLGKEIQKAEKDQYQSYVDHLKSRESAFDDYSKRALAEQRTMMERLQASQQDAEQKAKAAMAGGDLTAIRAAEAQQRKFLEDKKALLLQGIAIEEEATRKKIGNIGLEIAQAQKLNQYEGVDKLRQQRSSEQAELAALAERRKQIEIGAQADISKAATQFEDDRRQAQRQAADDNVRMIEEQRQANEDAYRQMQQVMDLRMSEGANLADARKQDIDNQVEAARAETVAAQASRQASLEGLSGIEAQQKAREILNANLRDTLDFIDLEKTKALEKLVIDGDILASQRQLLEVYREIAEQQGNRDQALAIEKQLQDVYAGQAKNIRDRVAAQSQAAAKAAKAEVDASKQTKGIDTQDVRESQLRMNAFWDQYMQRLNDYASLWQEITGETQNGFSRMAVAMGEYAKQAAQIGQYFEKNPDAFGNMTGAVEGLQQGQAALAAMAKTMIALRSNYAEGTKGYQDMTNAAERMMEVQRALQVVEGVLGVIHQFTAGDPYTAIPRALGVAAMIASMGVSTGASGGMSNRQARESTQTGGYSAAGGGVFGDASTKSDSISKSLEIVANNSNANLAYSAGMLRALNNIELAMKGTTNAVIRGVAPQAVPGLGTQLSGFAKSMNDVSKWVNGALLGPIGFFATDAINKVLAPLQKLLFNVTKKITDWGIKDIPQTLNDILANGFQALNYTQVTTTTKMLGITVSKKAKDYFSALDGEVANQFTRVIVSTADAVLQAGKAFGLSGKDFNDRLKGFVVDFGKFSTKGLKGEELQNAISQMFSSMSDDMARAFMPGLDAFQQAGEGYFETLIRVADGINVASGMLEAAGLKAINYQDIVLKQGDIASEIVRQSITAYEGIFSTIGQYIDGAVGSAEELLAVYQDLLSIRAMSSVVGLSFRNLSNDMIVAAGGVAALKDSISFYLENFIGIGGVAAAKTAEVADAFRRLNVRMPETQDAFRQLVSSIDQSTSAGQKLWAQLLKLAPAFLEAKQAAQELADLRTKLKGGNPFAELDSQWKQLWTDWGTVMDGELAMVSGPFQAKIKAQQNAIQGWAQAISTGTASIGLLTGELVRLSLAKAPAAVLKSIEQAIVSLTRNVSEWQKKIVEANKAIKALEGDQSAAAAAKRQEILQEQGWSLIGSIADMWEKMISGIRAAVASMQDQIDQLSPNAAQAVYNTASGRVTDAYANLNEYRGRMAGMGQATDTTVELGYIQQIQNAIMARYNAELALLQQAQQAMVAAETERLNAELDGWIEARNQALEVQIEAINAALEAEIQAINDALDARIKAQQDADEAVIKSMQKALDARIKAQQKADEAVIKAMQKRFDAENKAIQKQFDAIIKARQKEYDAANKLMQRQFDDERKALQKKQDAQMKILTDELDAANKLKDAIKSIADYAQSLKLGASSPLSPEAKLREAQRQYQELLAKAKAGDADVMAKLSGASDAYLEAARNYYGSSTNYEDIFKGVQQAMEAIGGMSAPDPDSIQSRIDALRESQEKEMQALQDKQDEIMDTIREQQQAAIDALRETQQEQLDAIRESQQEQIDAVREAQQENIEAMREAAQDQIDAVREAQQANIEAMRKAAQDQIEAARKAAQDQIDAARKLAEKEIADERAKTQQKIADLSDPEKNQAIRDLRDRTVAELQALQQQARDLEQAAQAKAEAWINEVRDWMTQNQLNDSTMIAALRGIYTGITQQPPAFAKGGQAMPGLAMVGEQGPEIVRFNTPGQVYTASETRQMLSGGDDEKIVQAIAELKAEMRAVVVTQSNANPQIIEKLSGMEQRLSKIERNARIQA